MGKVIIRRRYVEAQHDGQLRGLSLKHGADMIPCGMSACVYCYRVPLKTLIKELMHSNRNIGSQINKTNLTLISLCLITIMIWAVGTNQQNSVCVFNIPKFDG